MKTTRFQLPRFFVALSLALVGLMVLQIMLLRYAWDLKEQAFERGAQTALAATVVALESREIEGTAFDYFYSDSDSVAVGEEVVSVEAVAPHSPPRHLARGWPVREDSMVIVVTGDTDNRFVHSVRHFSQPLALRKVVGQWINQAPRPIRERLQQDEIAAVLRRELDRVGIDTEPSFGVLQPADKLFFGHEGVALGDRVAARDDSDTQALVVLASDQVTNAELLASPYRHQLFPLDPFSAPYDLVLVFPRNTLYLLQQIWPLWLASFLFMTVIVYSFARAWRTNLAQRRFADQLVDFINNMTHEFKTPISTVGLAGEAITRADVQAEPEVFARYVGMIRDENQRMHRQVEKILQMARFERGDLELRREQLAVHELLADVTESFALVIEQRGGQLTTEFKAPVDVVAGDRVHLESIFSNLVDNAVKYSPQTPQVRVTTARDGRFLQVKVVDQGLGIAREHQRRVFSKYYRCPTGNRHDVKGYGLGLSFVKSLVAAHGGFVELHSLPGRGTTVTVSLPLATVPDREES